MTEEIKKLIIYTRKMKKREPLYRDYPEESVLKKKRSTSVWYKKR